MNSFPIINNDAVLELFQRICSLYAGDIYSILQAVERATGGSPVSFKVNTGTTPEENIIHVESLLRRKADGYGQRLLVRIIEELFEQLASSGVVGVNEAALLACVQFNLEDASTISYLRIKKWILVWSVDLEGTSGRIEISIRKGNAAPGDIVPDYIIQYLQQSMNAYVNRRYGASLALVTVALEGCLRDALEKKGYHYQPMAPRQDVYELSDIEVHKDITGYRVTFPGGMPSLPEDYLSLPGDPSSKTFKIKRKVTQKGDFVLEIRKSNELLDYWSSDVVVIPGVKNVGGLGAALDISRNTIKIINPGDLPEDLDQLIQAVRNNLIHLSGHAMTVPVAQNSAGSPISLEHFLADKIKVFDSIYAISNAIDKIYNRISNNTL